MYFFSSTVTVREALDILIGKNVYDVELLGQIHHQRQLGDGVQSCDKLLRKEIVPIFP